MSVVYQTISVIVSAAGFASTRILNEVRMKKKSILVLVVMLYCCIGTTYGDGPKADPAEDAKKLGSPAEMLFWTPKQQVAGYRNMDKVAPTRHIDARGVAYPLPERRKELGAVEIRHNGTTMSVDQYCERQRVAGLLVIKDGNIVYERYGLGNTDQSLWVSFSVAKSVVSMLIGAAIKDGYIKSLDEYVTEYLPRLKGSPYDKVRIRDLMQMASGVEWDEDYADPSSDINRATWSTLGMYDYLRSKPGEAEPGTVFNYNTAETNLVGTLLRSAIGNNLSTYLTEKIWTPFGMESDANWMLTEPGGGEMGGCCISATLRDYGRIGLFALAGGRLPDGTEVLPSNWMKESTTPSKIYPRYGYLWWLAGSDVFRASGIFGQGIYINRKANVVIALHSARAVASRRADWQLQEAMCEALTKAVE